MILLYEAWDYMQMDFLEIKYRESIVVPLKYYGFEWVNIFYFNPDFPYYMVTVMSILAICISLGTFYKLSILLYNIFYTLLWLQEATTYSNVKYFISIVNFLLFFMSINQCFSVSLTKKYTVPYWNLWTLRIFLVLTYFFAGVAKINEDWLRGEPLTHWLAARTETVPVIGRYLDTPYLGLVLSWGGLFFELVLAPSLLFNVPSWWRFLALLSCFGFHIVNKLIFGLGILPYMYWTLNSLLLDPHWPRKILGLPHVATIISPMRLSSKNKTTLFFLTLFLTIQIAIPLRGFAYPGNPNWTQYGHNFSWKFRVNDLRGGLDTKILIQDPINKQTTTIPLDKYLVSLQATSVGCNALLIHQFAIKIAQEWERKYGHKPIVRADVKCALNYREKQRLIDADIDLAAFELWNYPHSFIMPLKI